MLTVLLMLSLMPTPTDTAETLPFYPAPIQSVTVDGTALAYYDSDPGAEASANVVLLVHGLGSNLSLWRHNLAALAAEHRVIALDLPGFGLSGKADVPATMPYFADTIAGFLDALGLAAVDYVGVSMGGQIGLTLALRHPKRVDRLVLASPAGIERFTDDEAAQLKALFTPQAVLHTPPAQYAANVARNFARYDSTAHGWLIAQRDAIASRDDFPDYAAANARAVAGMLDGPVFDRLGAVTQPTLILYGKRDHLIPNVYLHPTATTEAIARQALEAIPGSELHLIDEAGHLLNIEQADRFHDLVLQFLTP